MVDLPPYPDSKGDDTDDDTGVGPDHGSTTKHTTLGEGVRDHRDRRDPAGRHPTRHRSWWPWGPWAWTAHRWGRHTAHRTGGATRCP